MSRPPVSSQMLYRHAVRRALAGKRGRAFLRRLADALDAMPVKRLIKDVVCDEATGEVCALGALDPTLEDEGGDLYEVVAKRFNVPHIVAAEVAFVNDEVGDQRRSREARWERVRAWVARQLA